MRLLKEIRNYLGNYHVKSGVYHYYRNEFSPAIGFLRKALADESTLTGADLKNARNYLTLAHKGQALRLAAAGEFEEAVEELERAAEVHPSYPDIHFACAEILERLGRGAAAIEAYRRAIECHPAFLEARVALAYCLLAANRIDEAAEAFEKALQEKMSRIERPFERGIEFLRSGREEEALDQLHEVFRAVPALAEAYLARAAEHDRASEHDKALEALEKAAALNPKYPDLENFRGIVLCELDRHDEAVEAFARSATMNPGHMVPRLNLAFAHLRAGRPLEAETELQSILEEEPTEPVAVAKLAELREGRAADRKNMARTPGG